MRQFMQLMIMGYMVLATLSWANDDKHHQSISEDKQVSHVEEVACEQRVHIQVNGLVCDFCARALEKVFGKRSEVASIDVDLDHTEVIIVMHPGATLDEATLNQLMTNSGYNIVDLKRGCDV